MLRCEGVLQAGGRPVTEGIKGISSSKKMTIGIGYLVLATGLLLLGNIEGEQWVQATSIVVGALLCAQAYQDRK